MLYFKVLPTDPAYQQLNIIQKLVLLSAIDREKFEKFTLTENIIELAKLYSNPELYKKELEMTRNIETQDCKKVHNSFFDQISRDSRHAGKCILPKEISSVIENLYKDKLKEKQVKPIQLKKEEDEDVILG